MATIPFSRVEATGAKARGRAQVAGAVENLGRAIYNNQAKAQATQQAFLARQQEAIDQQDTSTAINLFMNAAQVHREGLQRTPDNYQAWNSQTNEFIQKSTEVIGGQLRTDKQKNDFNLAAINYAGGLSRDVSKEVYNKVVDKGISSLNQRIEDGVNLYAVAKNEDQKLTIAANLINDVQGAAKVGFISSVEAQSRLLEINDQFTEASLKTDLFNNPERTLLNLNNGKYDLAPVEFQTWREKIHKAIETKDKDDITAFEKMEKKTEVNSKLISNQLFKTAILMEQDGTLTAQWAIDHSDELTTQELQSILAFTTIDPEKITPDRGLHVDLIRGANKGDFDSVSEAQKAYTNGKLTLSMMNDVQRTFDQRNNNLSSTGRSRIDESILKFGGVIGDDLAAIRNSQAQREYTNYLEEMAATKTKINPSMNDEMLDVIIKRNTIVSLDITQRPRFLLGNTSNLTLDQLDDLVIKTTTAKEDGTLSNSEYNIEIKIINKLIQLHNVNGAK